MDFDDFGLEDAAILGGVLGFVEEATKAEEEGVSDEYATDVEEDFRDTVAEWVSRTPDVQLRLLYNENPALVEFMVRKAYENRGMSAKKIEEKEIKQVRKEMQEELERLEEEKKNAS